MTKIVLALIVIALCLAVPQALVAFAAVLVVNAAIACAVEALL
jgi:hypothetical protein